MQASDPERKAGLSFAFYSCMVWTSCLPSLSLPLLSITAWNTPPLEHTCKDPAASYVKDLVYSGCSRNGSCFGQWLRA